MTRSIRFGLGVFLALFLFQVLRDDGRFASPSASLLSGGAPGFPGGLASLIAAAAEAVIRVPVVQIQLLANDPRAIVLSVVSGTFLLLAWLADANRIRRRLVHAAGAALGTVFLLWFLGGPLAWGLSDDWRKDYSYYSIIDQAIRSRQLPFYIAASAQSSDRFLANLETPWAPHVVVLPVLGAAAFFHVQALLCLAIGLLGLVRLQQLLQVSTFWWAVLTLLFLLNGNILSHLAAGHTQWIAYFLLPWVLLAVCRTDDTRTASTALSLALALSAMIALGGWHVFVWAWLFTVVACAGRPALVPVALRASGWVAGLTAFRLIPAAVTFGGGTNTFLAAYSGPAQILTAATGGALGGLPLAQYEYAVFVGWVGVAVACVGALTPLNRPASAVHALWLPSLAMIVLSMGTVYERTLFRLPGLVSERVVTRLLIVGVLGLIVMGCATLSALDPPARSKRLAAGVALAAGLFLCIQLALHASAVRPPFGDVVSSGDLIKSVTVEATYYWAVWIGGVISCASGVVAARSLLPRATPRRGELSDRI